MGGDVGLQGWAKVLAGVEAEGVDVHRRRLMPAVMVGAATDCDPEREFAVSGRTVGEQRLRAFNA